MPTTVFFSGNICQVMPVRGMVAITLHRLASQTELESWCYPSSQFCLLDDLVSILTVIVWGPFLLQSVYIWLVKSWKNENRQNGFKLTDALSWISHWNKEESAHLCLLIFWCCVELLLIFLKTKKVEATMTVESNENWCLFKKML